MTQQGPQPSGGGVSSKVVAAGTAGALSTPLSVVVVWGIGQLAHGGIPPEVATAIGAMVSTVAAALAGYLKREAGISVEG